MIIIIICFSQGAWEGRKSGFEKKTKEEEKHGAEENYAGGMDFVRDVGAFECLFCAVCFCASVFSCLKRPATSASIRCS